MSLQSDMVDTLFDPEYDCFKGFMDMDGNRIGTRQSLAMIVK